jgi:hypothetical protein
VKSEEVVLKEILAGRASVKGVGDLVKEEMILVAEEEEMVGQERCIDPSVQLVISHVKFLFVQQEKNLCIVVIVSVRNHKIAEEGMIDDTEEMIEDMEEAIEDEEMIGVEVIVIEEIREEKKAFSPKKRHQLIHLHQRSKMKI